LEFSSVYARDIENLDAPVVRQAHHTAFDKI